MKLYNEIQNAKQKITHYEERKQTNFPWFIFKRCIGLLYKKEV